MGVSSFLYTQYCDRANIRLSAYKDHCCLVIDDNRPGIPPSKRDRVSERFYRIHNHEVSGCGIGLLIVMRVAELHQARVSLDNADS
ncbi:MAG: hypothetical protein IIC58_11195 [Proteobacteria bacterium]|nr:hypothetical protein [Pseudomonadota bacterium]